MSASLNEHDIFETALLCGILISLSTKLLPGLINLPELAIVFQDNPNNSTDFNKLQLPAYVRKSRELWEIKRVNVKCVHVVQTLCSAFPLIVLVEPQTSTEKKTPFKFIGEWGWYVKSVR